MISHKKVSFSILGFTLIELLITIAIVGIIAVVAFVALDPARRFAEARNATRWTDVAAILDAVKLFQVDRSGAFPWTPAQVTAGTNVYMIGTCTIAQCAAKICAAGAITAGFAGVPLSDLTGGTPAYLASIPTNQPTAGTAAWNSGTTLGASGYYLTQQLNGGTRIGSCDADDPDGAGALPAPAITITK